MPTTRTLGINCDSKTINIAVVEGATVLAGMPERIATPMGLEDNARLLALFEDVDRVIDTVQPDRIVILQPEPTYKATHKELTPRIARETIVRMVAVRRGIAVEHLARASVKARLGLPRAGRLDTHLEQALPIPVGQYWNSGRGLAAMTAVASGRES